MAKVKLPKSAPLLDLAEGKKLKREGHTLLESKHGDWLIEARAKAVVLCKRHGYVTADMLHAEVQLPEGAHQNLWGAVFRGRMWKPDGFALSKRVARRAGVQRIWKLA